MEPEKIGLLSTIEEVCKNPAKVSEFIARLAHKIDRYDILRRKRAKQPMSIRDIMTLAEPKLSGEKLLALRTVVEKLIEAHMTWEFDDSTGIDKNARDTVARACMYFLGDKLSKSGHKELAHYIHNTPHISMIINQPERLQMLEYGLIPDNRIYTNATLDSTQQLWIAHDAENGYRWAKEARIPNTIAVLSERAKNDFSIETLLHGERIHTSASEVLVFENGSVQVHWVPEKDGDSFTTLQKGAFLTEMSEIKQIEALSPERTPWTMYRIKWVQQTEAQDGVSESRSIELGKTLCVNSQNPELSFITPSKRYKIDKTGFVIDTDKSCLQILWTQGIEIFSFEFSHIYGVYKHKSIESLYFSDKENSRKKITFEQGQAQIKEIEAGEQEFFEKKK